MFIFFLITHLLYATHVYASEPHEQAKKSIAQAIEMARSFYITDQVTGNPQVIKYDPTLAEGLDQATHGFGIYADDNFITTHIGNVLYKNKKTKSLELIHKQHPDETPQKFEDDVVTEIAGGRNHYDILPELVLHNTIHPFFYNPDTKTLIYSATSTDHNRFRNPSSKLYLVGWGPKYILHDLILFEQDTKNGVTVDTHPMVLLR